MMSTTAAKMVAGPPTAPAARPPARPDADQQDDPDGRMVTASIPGGPAGLPAPPPVVTRPGACRRGPPRNRGHDPALSLASNRRHGRPIPTIGTPASGAPARLGPAPFAMSVYAGRMISVPGGRPAMAACKPYSRSGTARVAHLSTFFPGLKHPVAASPPAVGRPAVIGAAKGRSNHTPNSPTQPSGMGAEKRC
jgi:hypothetical protein